MILVKPCCTAVLTLNVTFSDPLSSKGTCAGHSYQACSQSASSWSWVWQSRSWDKRRHRQSSITSDCSSTDSQKWCRFSLNDLVYAIVWVWYKGLLRHLFVLLFTFIASEMNEKNERQNTISEAATLQPASSSTLPHQQSSPQDIIAPRRESYTEDAVLLQSMSAMCYVCTYMH